MATFPTALPTTSTIPVETSTAPLSTNHVASHQGAQNEIIAIATKVGVDGSAVTTTHDYKLSEVTSTDKAVGKTATQTLTNKTLTNPVVNVGSDATGDMYYRNAGVLTRIPVGTDNQIMKLNGTTPNWEAETATVDASATVKGVVEVATSAEVTAGTATGGTGASLAVTPAALAASTPVFNGSGLTNVQKLNITTSTTDVGTSSTAENTLLSYSLTGGILGTNNSVTVSAYITLAESINTVTTTLRFKYGATTIFAPTFIITAGSPSSYTYKCHFVLYGNGSTSAQNADLTLFGATSAATNNVISTSTSAEDSTAAKNIIITAQASSSSGNYHATIRNIVITKIV